MLVHANHSQSVDELAAAVGVSQGKFNKILTDDLNMSRVIQKSVPRILPKDQRDDRMTICGDLISSTDGDPTFNCKQNRYMEILGRLRDLIRHKRLELCRRKNLSVAT